MLLTEGDQPWSQQLPRLLAPQGVRTIQVHSVDEAMDAMEREPIHAAVVDLGLPLVGREGEDKPRRLDEARSGLVDTGGLKLLRIIRKLTPAPPAVVVRGRLFDGRTDDRLLAEALKLDAFSVLDQPVHLEQLLETLRRLLQRHYGGLWPTH